MGIRRNSWPKLSGIHLSNDFYKLWLDHRMVYSAALWNGGSDTLESAQTRKLRFHADACGATKGQRILEVGCGWGSGLDTLVNEYDVAEAVGLTLSQAQIDFRPDLAGDGRRKMLLTSWEGYADEAPFDAIISIGAFEHFGTRNVPDNERLGTYERFFEFCKKRLRIGGRLSLQTIAFGRLRRLSKFIGDVIWPESCLPTPAEVVSTSERWFEISSLVNHREHYSQTLREWLRRLDVNRAEAVGIVGETKVLDYERYLEGSAAAFDRAGLQLLRITLTKTAK